MSNQSGSSGSSNGGDAAHPAPQLPHGWVAAAVPGGVDIRVSPKRRTFLVAGILVVALAWTGATARSLIAHTALPLDTSPLAAWPISVLLLVFAVWCAFGDEVWHAGRDLIEHRVGIGAWKHIRTYRRARLEVIQRFNKYGIPYSRLYVVSDGRFRFLIERTPPEMADLARFFAHYTGWEVQDKVQPFGGAP